MRGIFCKSGFFSRSGFLDMWKMLPGIFQHFNFQILNVGKIDIFVKMFDISAIPARSVWCSLPSGNPKSGCWLSVNGITSVRGDPADRIPREFTHGFIWKLKNIWIVCYGNSLFVSWMDPWSEFPGNSVSWITSDRGDSVGRISWECGNGFQMKSLNFFMGDPIKSWGNPCG